MMEENELIESTDKEQAYQTCKKFVDDLIEDVKNGGYHEDDDYNYYAFETICEAIYPKFFERFNKNT